MSVALLTVPLRFGGIQWVGCSAGYSGGMRTLDFCSSSDLVFNLIQSVLFALMTLDCHLQSESILQVWIIRMPAWLMPWFTLIWIQLLFTNIAWWGHLAGILSGCMLHFRISITMHI